MFGHDAITEKYLMSGEHAEAIKKYLGKERLNATRA